MENEQGKITEETLATGVDDYTGFVDQDDDAEKE